MSAQAQHALRRELDKLEELQAEIEKRAKKLKKMVREQGKIMDDAAGFEKLFGDFREKITFATSIAETYLPPSVLFSQEPRPLLQQPRTPLENEETKESRIGFFSLGIGKVVVAVAALVLCYAAVYMDWLPEEIFMWILAATVTLMFLPSVLSAIPNLVRRLRSEGEELPVRTPTMRLKEVKDTLTKIAQEYEWYFWMVREQPYKSPLQRYHRVGKPEEMYLVSKQAPIILLFDLPRMIDQILQECNDVIWNRKVTIASAIVEVSRPAPRVKGG